MLRFGTPPTDRVRRSATRVRLRIWLLFAVACVVLFGIRMLRQPETAQRIDSLFLPPEESSEPTATIRDVLGSEANGVELGSAVVPEQLVIVSPAVNAARESMPFDLSSVRDNTYFRPQENAAWFAVFDWLVKDDPLNGESLGEVSYAQFIDQPGTYRGQVVTVRGTVERVELLDAPRNDIGIKQYHRLILRPKGGGVWPIVVYSLELPADFSIGGKTDTQVEVDGVFFKNWSYSWKGGLGLAPVILTKTFEWHPLVSPKRPPTKISIPALFAVISAAGAFATLFGWFVWRHTRRPSDALVGQRLVIGPPEDG